MIRASAFKTVKQVGHNMKAYRITGLLPLGSMTQNFTQDVAAPSKKDAEHIVLSTLGGRHKVTRRQISIESINEIKPNQSKDPKVLHEFREKIALSSEEE
tara:strand:+ start:1224 stop:1523 length:300 start_codon:yes stop_codon:yes gene_type:complete